MTGPWMVEVFHECVTTGLPGVFGLHQLPKPAGTGLVDPLGRPVGRQTASSSSSPPPRFGKSRLSVMPPRLPEAERPGMTRGTAGFRIGAQKTNRADSGLRCGTSRPETAAPPAAGGGGRCSP